VTGNDPATMAAPKRPLRARRSLQVASVLLVLIAGAGIFAAVSDHPGTVSRPLVDRTHRAAPGFTLPDLTEPSRTVSLTDLRGKGLVLNFWGSWCPACRTEMPLLESAFRSEHGKVAFVGIDSADSRGAAISFVKRVHVTYESLFDPQEVAASAYSLYGLPTTVFISSSGKMLGRYFGQFDSATLAAAMTEAFGPKR
jgi:thiol-disulfide isomerase/thioredoxin